MNHRHKFSIYIYKASRRKDRSQIQYLWTADRQIYLRYNTHKKTKIMEETIKYTIWDYRLSIFKRYHQNKQTKGKPQTRIK